MHLVRPPRRPRKPSLSRMLATAKRHGVGTVVTPNGYTLHLGPDPAPSESDNPLDQWMAKQRARDDLRASTRSPRRLADGSQRTYWYAWKGGPPLRGEPGTPEFIASYNEAVARKVDATDRHAARAAVPFSGQRRIPVRSRATHRRDYIKQIKRIEHAFGDFPIKALTIRGHARYLPRMA